MSRDSILTAVERYYTATFAEHGPSARGVDWNSEESQHLRFVQLAQLFGADRAFSINDLGCGYGAFASFLAASGFAGTYTGYELSQAMVDHARSTFRAQPSIDFQVGSSMRDADYSIASGIFNVKLGFAKDEWSEYVDHMLGELAEASRKGFAFNMLTSYSDLDRRRADLHYADPRAVFGGCMTRFSRHVSLLHDYPLWEFTIIVRFDA